MLSLRALLVYLVCLLIGCFAYASNPEVLSKRLDERYSRRISFNQTVVSKSSLNGCSLGSAYVQGLDPVTMTTREVTLKQYRPAASMPQSNRAVIIMPPTGGENVFDENYANQLCSRGVRVVILKSFQILPDSGMDLGMYDREAIRSLVAIRHTITFLNATGSKSVGILGTSLGALEASFATVIDPRLNTAVFIAGGVGLAEIVAKSEQKTTAQLRQFRMDAGHLTRDEYAEAVRKAIHIDVPPLLNPNLAKTKKVLCVLAMRDTYVPTSTQIRLYEAFGSQGVITFEDDHVETISRTATFKSLVIVNFLMKNLKP